MKQTFKFILFFLAIIFMKNIAISQTFDWAKNNISSPNADIMPQAMDVDAAGNVYIVGGFFGSADFDPGAAVFNLTTTTNEQDIYIQKLSPSGDFLWAKLLSGSDSYSLPTAIKVDAAGSVYVTGNFDDAVDFNPGTAVNNVAPQGFQDGFLLKLDANGNFSWVNTYGGTGSFLNINTMTLEGANPIVAGSFSGTVDFDVSPANQIITSTGSDGFVLKLNSAGNYTFVKQYTSPSFAGVSSIAVDNAGNIICAGLFYDSIDLDPSSSISTQTSLPNSQKTFLSKLSPIGNYILGTSFADGGDLNISGLKVDMLNNILMCGSYYESCDVDPSSAVNNLPTPSFQDGYVLKFDGSANLIWAKTFVGDDEVLITGLDIDNIGNLYLSAYFTGSVDADPGSANSILTSPNLNYNALVSKLNVNGDYVFGHSLGSPNANDGGFAIRVVNNNIYSTGAFSQTVDFNPNAGSANLTALGLDNYCFKWSQCTPSITNLSATGCSYTLNGQTYSGNGVYSQQFVNSSGCDSSVFLTLTGSSTNTILTPTVCGGSYTLNGQTYTSSGVYTQNFTNSVGCDSNTTINLTLGVPTASIINETTCDFFFWNGNAYFNSGVFIDTLINSTGCDSIVTLNLTINQSVNTYLPVNTCGPYTFNGVTYSNSGTYDNYFVASNGCDSVVTLDLTISPIPPTNLTQNACNNYTWYGQTYNTTGIYNHMLTSSQGCDSMLVLNLNITTPNINMTQVGTTLTASAPLPATYQWIKCNPYSLISGATGQSHIITANGNYAVIVTQNGCTDTSACKSITNLGLNDDLFSKQVSLYPNPANEYIQLGFEKMLANLSIKLLSLTGQIVFESNYQSISKIEIPVKDLANGIYFVHLNNEQNNAVFKFTKN